MSKEEKAHMFVGFANAALKDGEPIAALQDLAAAEELEPNMPELHHTRALAYVAEGEFQKAIDCARKAVSIQPRYSAANNTLGKLLLDLGRSDEAEPYLLAAAKDDLYGESYKPLTNLGILYYRKMDYDRAGGYLKKATASAPKAACVAYYYLGHISLSQSRFSEAIHDYGLATQRFCTDFADAHLALGIAYERSGQYNMARKKFLEIRERFPSFNVADQAINHLKNIP